MFSKKVKRKIINGSEQQIHYTSRSTGKQSIYAIVR
jgi:hypothetical protein